MTFVSVKMKTTVFNKEFRLQAWRRLIVKTQKPLSCLFCKYEKIRNLCFKINLNQNLQACRQPIINLKKLE